MGPNMLIKGKKHIKKALKKVAHFVYRIGCVILPLQNKVIAFNCSNGRNYAGNVKYIYEEMIKQGLDKEYKCVWSFRDTNTYVPGNCKIVKYGRFSYLYYMAIAKIWICDVRQPAFLIKRKGVSYIQTWHGTPLKKLGMDMDDVFMAAGESIETYKSKFLKNAQTWDYLISQNPFSTQTFRRCFAFQKTMLKIGYPRNDILIKENNSESVRVIKEKLGLPLDKKIAIYAPTWRDDEFNSNKEYKFSTRMDFGLLKQEMGQEYVIIVKYHYLVSEAIDWTPYKGFVYNFDATHDISLLYLVSDILITDYSSVMFDYSVLKRPMFFYCYDLEKYKNHLRGFYFDFEMEAPGPISETTVQLIRDIKEYDKETYKERYEAFSEKYNPWDNGEASEKVVDLIKSL